MGAERERVPRAVAAARWLAFAQAMLWGVAIVFAVVTSDGSAVDDAALARRRLFFFISLILTVLLVVYAFKLPSGRAVARNVVVAVSVLNVLLAIAGGQVVGAVLALAIVVALLLGEARRFFAGREPLERAPGRFDARKLPDPDDD